MLYVFGDYTLHTTRYELRRLGGEPCKLEPQVFNVLVYLIQQRARVVTRDELVAHLWPGLCLHDTVVSKAIMEARKAVGDNGQLQQVIKTIHGRGYRFIAPTIACEDEALTPVFPGPNVLPPRDRQEASALSRQDSAGPLVQDVFAGEYTIGTVVCGTLMHTEFSGAGVTASDALATRQMFFALAHHEGQRSAGMLTYFGTAGLVGVWTQEAHAQRAMHAVLTLHERLQMALQQSDMVGPDVGPVRYGAHTGPLPCPPPTALPWSSAWATADTTLLAIWLHYLAYPGTLLSSQATRAALDTTLPWVEHGLIPIPMQTDPMLAYRLGLSPMANRPMA